MTLVEKKPASLALKEAVEYTSRLVPFVQECTIICADPAENPYWEHGDIVAGWYETRGKAISVNHAFAPTDWEHGEAFFATLKNPFVGIILHEVGHMVLSLVENTRVKGKRIRTLVGESFQRESDFESDMAKENRDEFFAESFAQYVLAPDSCTIIQREMVELVRAKLQPHIEK